MNLRRLILLVGAVALVATDQSAAQQADNSNPANLPTLNEAIPHTDYVKQCQSAVSNRRADAVTR
jgi:hypothetical protein